MHFILLCMFEDEKLAALCENQTNTFKHLSSNRSGVGVNLQVWRKFGIFLYLSRHSMFSFILRLHPCWQKIPECCRLIAAASRHLISSDSLRTIVFVFKPDVSAGPQRADDKDQNTKPVYENVTTQRLTTLSALSYFIFKHSSVKFSSDRLHDTAARIVSTSTCEGFR